MVQASLLKLSEAFRLKETLIDSGLLTEAMGANRLLF